MLRLEAETKQCIALEYVKLAELKNAVEAISTRKDEKLDEEFVESIKKLGVLTPIVVKDGKVVEGYKVLKALLEIYKGAEIYAVQVPVAKIVCEEIRGDLARLVSQIHSTPPKKPKDCIAEVYQRSITSSDFDVHQICPICLYVMYLYLNGTESVRDVLRKDYVRCLKVYEIAVKALNEEALNKMIAQLKYNSSYAPEVEQYVKKRKMAEETAAQYKQYSILQVEPQKREEAEKFEEDKAEEAEKFEEDRVEEEVEEQIDVKAVETVASTVAKEERREPGEAAGVYAYILNEVNSNRAYYENIARQKNKLYAILLEVGIHKDVAMFILANFGKDTVYEISELMRKNVPIDKIVKDLVELRGESVEASAQAAVKFKELASMFNVPTIVLLHRLAERLYYLAFSEPVEDLESFVSRLSLK